MYRVSSPFEKSLIAFIVFYPAVVFTLPVPYEDTLIYPWWARRISFGNVMLHEFLFLLWVGIYGFQISIRRLLNRGIPTRQSALVLIFLAIWCGIVSLQSPLVFQDMARSLRLVLMAFLMLSVTRWSCREGDLPLQALLAGFTAGTIINLIISFQNPFIVNETMRLSGQNTPGVGMAVAIHLAGWYFLKSESRKKQLVALLTAILFLFGSGISFSRIAWLISGFGVVAWIYILFVVNKKRIRGLSSRVEPRFWAPIISIGLIVLLLSPIGQEYFEWVSLLFSQKEWLQGSSNTYRLSYVFGVGEIIAKYPWGVGYSGFFDAMINTDIYASGNAAREESLDANPHSGFLYYLSAGGVLGGILAVTLFCTLMNSMRIGLTHVFGRQGWVLFALISLSFLMIGLVVPYMFNSIILIVPTAIMAGGSWRRNNLIAFENRLQAA